MTTSSISQTNIASYLNTTSNLLETYLDAKAKEYIAPARKNLGVVTLVVVREIIAPAIFKHEDEEPLTVEVAEDAFIRATPSKFKFVERGRCLEILRYLEIGGVNAQNRIFVPKGHSSGDYFDMATFLLGDSGLADGRVLSSSASVKYSDALCLLPEAFCVDSTFHVRGNEQGTLFDEIQKKNTDNIFSRIFIKPKTLLVQTLTFTGKTAPAEIVDLLLATLAAPKAYGGQTSVTGVNVKTHIAGVFGGNFEVAQNSPYVLLSELLGLLSQDEMTNVELVKQTLFNLFEKLYPSSLSSDVIEEIQSIQLEKIASKDHVEFSAAAKVISEYYTRYFDK